MANFKIQITADPSGAVSGAKTAQEALKQVGDAGKQSVEGVSAATGKLSMRKTELKQAINALGRAFPQFSAMARVALNPLTLGVVMLTSALGKIRGNINAVSVAIEDVPWEGFSNKAKRAADQVGKIRDAAQEAADASARLTDVFNARQSAEEKVDAARKRLELAQAQGIEDPARRAQAEAEIEGRYARRELEREERGRQFQVQAQERRARDLADQEKRLGGRIAVGQARLEETGRPEDIEQRLAVLKRNLAAEQEGLVKAEDEFEKKFTGFAGFMNQGPTMAGAKASLLENIEQRQVIVGRLQGMIGRDEGRLRQASPIAAWLGQAQEQYAGLRQSREGIEAMFPTQRTVAGIEGAAARQVYGMEGQARAASARNEAAAASARLLEQLVGAIEGNKGISERVVRELDEWRAWQKRMERVVGNQR